jgi:uncharacterized protein (UPF0332 family)
MEAREFLVLAQELTLAGGPARYRSAISRTYYAVYHVAYDLLQNLGFEFGRGHEAHQAVDEYLVQTRVTSLIQVGARLRRLRAVRVKADYWMRDPQPEQVQLVATWLEQATNMIAALDAAAADAPTRERMTRALQAWEQGRGRSNR